MKENVHFIFKTLLIICMEVVLPLNVHSVHFKRPNVFRLEKQRCPKLKLYKENKNNPMSKSLARLDKLVYLAAYRPEHETRPYPRVRSDTTEVHVPQLHRRLHRGDKWTKAHLLGRPTQT